jgi:hypothetical protein
LKKENVRYAKIIDKYLDWLRTDVLKWLYSK